MVILRFPFPRPHHAASMAIGGPEATDDASLATEAKRRTAQDRLCCLARNDGHPGVPMQLAAWGGCRQGKKVETRRCGIGGRGVSRPSARSAHWRGRLERSLNGWQTEMWRPFSPETGRNAVSADLTPCPWRRRPPSSLVLRPNDPPDPVRSGCADRPAGVYERHMAAVIGLFDDAAHRRTVPTPLRRDGANRLV